MSKTVLVTGGAGYVGSAVAVDFLNNGYEVVVFDDMSTGQPSLLPKGVKVVKGDITNYQALATVCREHDFNTVVHCAAKKSVGESEIHPAKYFQTNVAGSLNVLSVMEECSIPNIVFSSTASVYALVDENELLTESSPIVPPNVYGQTKRMVEEMILTFARLGRIKNYTIFRYFNVAGDAGLRFVDSQPQNIFPLIVQAVDNKEPFSIFGDDYSTPDGTGVRDYIHIHDLVAAHRQVVEQEVSGVFNLGTGAGYSVKELLAAFEAQLTAPIVAMVVQRRPGDPAHLVADAGLATETFGWKPEFTLEEMVSSTLDTYLNHTK